MEILVIAVLIGLIPAAIAQSKGRSFIGWWIFGALLFIVALPCAMLISPDNKAKESAALASRDNRKCPHCAEIIKSEAKVCRYCGRDVEPVGKGFIHPAFRAEPIRCNHCRNKIDANAHVCPICGATNHAAPAAP